MSAAQTAATVYEDRLLRVRDVMQMLGVSRATAYRLMNDGTLPVVRFGAAQHSNNKMLRVRQSTLMTWMRQNETRPCRAAKPARLIYLLIFC